MPRAPPALPIQMREVTTRRVALALLALGMLACRGDAAADPAANRATVEAAPDAPAVPVVADAPPAPADDFDALLAGIEAAQRRLGARWRAAADDDERAAIRAETRRTLVDTIADELFPRWLGTPWGLGKNSTATRPHEAAMTVGCSYFVTSVLQNAGLALDNRYRFAQAPALHIQGSLAPGRGSIHRFLSIAPAKLERRIRALGEGLYLIGLNNHIGFVLVRAGLVRFVHASYTGDQQVSDEPLVAAEAIANSQKAGYFVSPVFAAGADGDEANAWLVERWLEAEAVTFVAQ